MAGRGGGALVYLMSIITDQSYVTLSYNVLPLGRITQPCLTYYFIMQYFRRLRQVGDVKRNYRVKHGLFNPPGVGMSMPLLSALLFSFSPGNSQNAST